MPHFICTACGMQYADSDKSAGAMRRLRGGAAIRAAARAKLDDAASAFAKPHERLARIRQRHHRHRLDPAVRHRPARAAVAHRGRQHFVGLRRHARRRDDHRDQGPRRPAGDRHLASAFLHDDGGVGAGLRLSGPSQCRRQSLDHAGRSGDQTVAGRYLQIMGRHHADPLRRPFRRRHGAALGARRVRPRRRLFRRHSHRRHRPQVAVLHAQLSEFHSAVRVRSGAHRAGDAAVFLRPALRPLLRPRHRQGCKIGFGKIRRALHRRGGGEEGSTQRVTLPLPSRPCRRAA